MDERVVMSLGVLKVAACLERAGHPVEVLDLSGITNYEDVAAHHALRTRARIFGFTATTPQMPAVGRIVRVLRDVRPSARLILGGPHITLVNAAWKRERKFGKEGRARRALDTLIDMMDVLVAGDGEEAVFQAIDSNAPQLIDADDPKTALFLTSKRLEELPLPARHLVDVSSYHFSIEGTPALSMIAQLGCPFRLRVLRRPRIGHASAHTHAQHGQCC